MLKRLVGWVTLLGVVFGALWLFFFFFGPSPDRGDLTFSSFGTNSLKPVAPAAITGPRPLLGPLWFWRSLQLGLITMCWAFPAMMIAFCAYKYILPFINERERIYADPDTGLYPVIRKRHGGWFGNREEVWYESDLNAAMHPHRYVTLNGKMAIETHGDYDTDVAGGILEVQRNVARYANGGGRGTTVAEARERAGEFEARADHARLRRDQLLAKNSSNSQVIDVQGEPQPEITDAAEALRYTVKNPGQIVVGQQLGGLRELTIANLMRDPFWLIAGKSGSGKTTTTAFQMALGSLISGWGVVVFEPNNKADWQKFASHVNYHKINSDNVLAHMRMLYAEYQRRGRIIEQYKLGQWHERPDLLPPYVVFFEELGRTREDLMLDPNPGRAKRARNEFDAILMMLVKAAANTGFRFVGVDQYPNKYPAPVRSAFQALAYYMGAGSNGQIVGSHYNHRLKGTRMFDALEADTNGNPIFFGGWHVEPLVEDILAKLRVPSWPSLFNHANCDSFKTDSAMTDEEIERIMEDNEADDEYANEYGSEESPQDTALMLYDPAMPPADIIAGIEYYRLHGRWDEFSKAYFAHYPDARQRDLRLAMSAHGGNSDPDKIKGMGFLMFHCYSPHGNRTYRGVIKHLENISKKNSKAAQADVVVEDHSKEIGYDGVNQTTAAYAAA